MTVQLPSKVSLILHPERTVEMRLRVMMLSHLD